MAISLNGLLDSLKPLAIRPGVPNSTQVLYLGQVLQTYL